MQSRRIFFYFTTVLPILSKKDAKLSRSEKKTVILNSRLTDIEMICEYITRYLLLNKRIVVPGLGAFVVNPSNGRLLFVELLKQDDGVLRNLLSVDGLSPVDAAGAIDRFVFEIRHRVESGGTATLKGIGRLSRAEDGLYRFEYDPDAGHTDIAVPASVPEPQPAAAEPEPMLPDPTPEPVAEPEPESVYVPDPQHEEPEPAEVQAEEKPTAEEPAASPVEIRPRTVMTPETYVKGLRYGKPNRPSKDDIRYVGSSPRRGVDKFVIIAVVAAALALTAIIYGYVSSRNAESCDFEEQIEMTE